MSRHVEAKQFFIVGVLILIFVLILLNTGSISNEPFDTFVSRIVGDEEVVRVIAAGDAWAVITRVHPESANKVRLLLIRKSLFTYEVLYDSADPPEGEPQLWASPPLTDFDFDNGFQEFTVKVTLPGDGITPGCEKITAIYTYHYEWIDNTYVGDMASIADYC